MAKRDAQMNELGDETGYLYRRIGDLLRSRIAQEHFRPGERMPSEVQLARDFGTTRVTVAKALGELERDGLIERLVGRGTFVASSSKVTASIDTSASLSFEERVSSSGKEIGFRLLSFSRVQPPGFAREQLGVKSGAEVYELDRLRLVDGRVVGEEVRYIPIELASRITATMLAERSSVEIVSEALGHRVPTISVTMYPEVAGAELAAKLEIAPGSPVTVKEHVYRDADGRVLLCGKSTFTSDVRMTYVTGSASSERLR